jgi:hypothetical protein
MMRGATPAVARPMMRASGFSPERRRQSGELVEAGLARMFVALDARDIALAVLDLHRDDFAGEAPVLLRGGGARLAAQRESVLVGARNLKFLGDVFAGLRHRIDAILRFHQRIDEAPADRRVIDFDMARESLRRLALHEWRARHRFDAAGDRHFDLAGAHGARRRSDRVEARAAQAIDRRAGNACRQSGEQARHTRDVAIVLARLIGAAGEHVVDRMRIEAGRLGERRFDGMGEEVVRTHG